MRLLLAVVVVGLLNTPLLHEATAAPVTTAALRITPATSGNPGQEIYYYGGRYYPYHYRGGYYSYAYRGSYYNHRYYRYGRWHYY
jgi:hypothetical protein